MKILSIENDYSGDTGHTIRLVGLTMMQVDSSFLDVNTIIRIVVDHATVAEAGSVCHRVALRSSYDFIHFIPCGNAAEAIAVAAAVAQAKRDWQTWLYNQKKICPLKRKRLPH